VRGDQRAPEPETGTRRPPLARLTEPHNLVLGGLLAVLSVSWYYSWFHDGTHPLGGIGWADQKMYTATAWRFADWHLPTVAEMHFDPNYSLLGGLAAKVWHADPFWIVSYLLLMGSAIFLFYGCRALLGTFFASVFLVGLFVWDLHARTFDYASELFAVPWNNQVLFFTFSFFFWLYATRARGRVDTWLMVVMGFLVGANFMTREESLLFTLPLAVFYLAYRKLPLRTWVYTGIAAFVAALPGVLIKWHVLGKPWAVSPGRPGDSYEGTASGYFNLHHLLVNTRDVIVNSNFASVDAKRAALLQSQPWLWLAPIGLLLVLLSKRSTGLMKFFIAMSIALFAFYLSGDNVEAAKLKFHCLRYMTPGFIALTFGVVVVLASLWDLVRSGGKRGAPHPAVDTTEPEAAVETGGELQPVGTGAVTTENISR
jgi:hypothetical protein